MLIHRIWDDLAQMEVPESFVEATVGERRKVYGMGTDIPMHMLIDREKRVFISTAKIEEQVEAGETKNVEEWTQLFHHMLRRNVPGYHGNVSERNRGTKSVCSTVYVLCAGIKQIYIVTDYKRR